ncbi:disintegrin and metalloproteinase domain-containing protein 10 isoform X2 [Prorops nasuta]|uniref:disintegrin and metalloproteinase domain-containing protein 10 isoform X2 n=1 Tax=Prorops nasuta TaxID=863751 RepID=UPI0034D01081
MFPTVSSLDDECEEDEDEEEGRFILRPIRRSVMLRLKTLESPRFVLSSRTLVYLFLATFIYLMTISHASPLHPTPLMSHYKGITRASYIRYYEVASYDTATLRRHRSRTRREASDTANNQPLLLPLRTLDRSWTLKLVRDGNLFAKDASFESTSGPLDFDISHIYVGTLLEDENALVQGLVTKDGLFDGTVVTNFDEFYIEPVDRYLPNTERTSPYYHSIAYRASDVTKPPEPLFCASHRLHQNSINKRQLYNNTEYQTFYEPLLGHRAALYSKESNSNIFVFKENNNLQYSDGQKAADVLADDADKEKTREERDRIGQRHLRKRATVDPRKTTCMLYLQADHQFFARYGTEEACIEVMTRHVQRVNAIYKHTDFNQDGRPDNISFMIKRIKVHSGDALKDPNYRFPGNYGVEKYLELFSEEDYDAFCLAYMFTYRDFEMGTLGLAWTGDLKNAGGVCEKNGHYRGSMKSLNTGIVTLLNYGKHVPPAVSHVTLAHEIGHNFGSPHDPEQCTPGGEDGNFIMFARATSGDKRNNNRFSPCSLNAINPVLNNKARSPKGCFTEPQISLCGNGVVEEGEECDCGWEEDCRDSCCYPQRRYPPTEETPCTLTPGSVCSPSQGPCCTAECKLRFGDKCREDNGCRDSSFCDGRSPYCPQSINKPNKTICNRELVCFMGECTGSICLAYGLESCQCIPGPNDPSTKACELCCRLPGENQPCISSFDWNSPPYDIPDMFSKPGTPCNDYNGYCDIFQKCREVDPSGPLATLTKFLLSEESLATFRRWMTEHWYLVALIFLAAILFLVGTMKLCSKRPDLKLKSVTIIHSATTETVRLPPEGAEGVTVHPPAVRAKLPLSKKVREKKYRRKHNESHGTSGDKANSKDAGKKKKVKAPPKRSSTAPLEDLMRKRPAELAVGVQENKRKKITSSRDKPSTENNVNATGDGDNKKKRKKRHRKEVIDYSAMQTENDPEANTDPKSKVRSWLLASSQCRPELSRRNSALPKSKSTPVELTAVSERTRLPSKQKLSSRRPTDLRDAKCSPVNNAKRERARLQVVYKPPFKFNVKLRKAEKVVQPLATTATTHANLTKPAKIPRTGVLLRTVKRKDRVRIGRARQIAPTGINNNAADLPEPPNSDLHTVPSDLEVLLSESEFLFSDT